MTPMKAALVVLQECEAAPSIRGPARGSTVFLVYKEMLEQAQLRQMQHENQCKRMLWPFQLKWREQTICWNGGRTKSDDAKSNLISDPWLLWKLRWWCSKNVRLRRQFVDLAVVIWGCHITRRYTQKRTTQCAVQFRRDTVHSWPSLELHFPGVYAFESCLGEYLGWE